MKSVLCLSAVFTLLLTVFSSSAVAQPVNDDCSGAIQITHDAFPVYNLCSAAGATPSMGGSIKDVWYKFTATSDLLFVRLTNSPMTYEVYSGGCGNLTIVNGYAPVGGFCADLPDSTALNVGQTYYLRVYFNATINDYQPFHVCLLARHTYDECNTAPALTMNYDTIIDSLSFSSMMYGRVSTHSPMPYPFMTTGGKEDIWLKFTATDTAHTIFLGSISYNSCWTSSSYPYFYARYTDCSPMDTITPVLQNPKLFDSTAYVDFTSLTVGNDYYIRLWTNKSTGVSADFFVGVGPLGATGIMPPPLNVNSIASETVKFSVVPNPATSHIKITGQDMQDSEVSILDITGKMKASMPYRDGMQIDVSDYAPGVYLVRFSGEGGGSAYFVKQ